MSQPKRYAIDSDGVPYPLDTGDYVRHSDYAALAAENERLRKAGDAVSRCLEAYLYCKPYEGPMTIQCLALWNAAKEGRDAK